MVAVVGGAGLGLANTSREVAGAAAGLAEAALGRGPDRATVNAATGNLVLQSRDEFLVGVGADIELLRTYNSQGGWDGDNADGWRIGYYRRVSGLAGTVNAAGSTVRRIEADGHEAVYIWDGTRYLGRDGAGAHDTLTFDATTRVWTWTDGDTALKERYAETGTNSGLFRLVQLTDTEGHATKIAYDGAGLISSVASWKAGATAADESVALQYDAARRLTQLTTQYKDAAGVARSRVRVRYEYDAASRLSLVRTDLTPEDGVVADGREYTVRYGYDAAGRLASVVQGDGSSLSISYDAAGRVRQLRDALGRTTTLDHDPVARRTTVTDALGQLTVLGFDAGDRLVDIAGAATGGTSLHRSFGYDGEGNLVSSRNPRGEETVFQPSAQGLVTRSVDATGNVVERSYDAGNRLLAEVRYRIPDADGAAGPAVASGALQTRYVYDTSGGRSRLRFVVAPEGCVTQLDYNGLGQLAVRTRYADVVYATTGEPALADLVAWSAGLSTAQRAAVERSEYGYDLRGQQSVVRTYAANSVSGGSVVYGGLAEQRFVYDAFGRLLQSIDALGRSTAWAYDGMDRLLTTTDAVGTVTLSRYDDAGRRTVLQLGNGLERISSFDAAGRLVSTAEQDKTTALGETRYFYDALDRLVMTLDPTGLCRWTLYDAAGRRGADIDAAGHFVEYAYDAAGRLVQTLDHAVRVGAAALATLLDSNGQPVPRSAAELRPAADPANDRIETRYYDGAGRLVAVQAADGAVTETQYDGASRVVATVTYANVSAVTRVDLSAGSTLAAPPSFAAARPVADPARDRTARNFHSDAGLLRATLDAEGYLVEHRYDAAGRLVERLAYGNATAAAVRANGTLAQLLPSASPADRRCVYFYDGQGRQVGELDADGYLTETVYDGRGNRRQSIRYATPILQVVSAGAALAALRPASIASDRSTRWEVDPLDRVCREIATDGSVTRYDYDALGHVVSTVRAEGMAEERTQTRRFDLQGRVVAELSAEGAALLAAAPNSAEADAIWAAHGSHISYDDAGRRTARRDPNGSLTLYYQDAAGREICSILQTAEGGEVRQTSYNAFGEVETVTSYANRLAAAELASLTGGTLGADLAARIGALADPARDLRSTTLRTRRGQVVQAIDALGARADMQYTAFGEIAATQQDLSGGARLLTTRTYDRRGLLLATTADPGGIARVTRSNYDAFGRFSSTTDAQGQVTSYTYAKTSLSAAGRSVNETGPAGTHTTVYDAFGGVLQQTDALGHTVRYVYDAAARKMTMTTAENVVVVTETTRHGEVARVTDGNGASTSYTYDRDGHLLTTTDAVGNVEQHRYDAAGRRVATTLGLKSNGTAPPLDTGGTTTTETVYDAHDRVLIRRVDPNGLRLETRYEYDGRGLAVKSIDPAGIVTTQAFDAAGRLQETVVDGVPGGLQLRTTYRYDAQGRVLRVVEGAGTTGARTVETRYDALGRRTAAIVDPDGLALTRRWEYDAAGHVVLERDPLGQPTRHVYDAAGRLELSIDATGSVTQRLYDLEGRLVGLRACAQRLGGTTTPELSPAILSDAQIRNAVAALASAADALTQYGLDRDGRVVYSIDPVGAVTKNRYDKADRVIETIRYATLKPGSWTATSTPTVDAARDQSSLNVYDAAGRLRYVVDALDFVTETAYDPQGRTVMVKRYAQSIVRPGAATEASVATAVAARVEAANDRTEYSVYDAAGRMRFAVDAEGYVTENRYDALGRVTDTWRSQVKGSFAAPPTLANAEAAFRTVRSFTGSASGLSGTAHVYEADHIRLVSRPEATGASAITRGTATLEPGAAVAFDVTPLGMQPDLTVALESAAGAPLTRFGLVLGSDGRLDARTIDRASGIDQRVDIGAYVAGASYRVEIVTSEGAGAVLYVYERGKTRDTGIVYRCEEPLSWSAFSVLFQASRDAALTAESSTVVDDMVESRAAWIGQQRYDATGRRVASIDGEGVVTRYTWDAAGRVIDTVAAAGRPEASTTRRAYDAAGRLLEETAAYGSAAASTTRHEYDAAGRLATRVDPRGLALARSDSAWAQSERAALGYPVTLAGLSAAQKQALSDRYTTRFEYDAAGRRTRSSEPLGRITSVDYDAFGRAVRMTEPGGSGPRTSYTFYDRLGRAVQEVDAERYLTIKAYDAFGNLAETVRHDGRVAGTLAPQSAGNASIAVGSADPGDGRAYVIAAPAVDATTRMTYDRRNQRLTERDAEGDVEGTLEALDAFGQRRSAVNRLGGRATFAYDRLGRLTRETLPVRAAKADRTLIDVVHQYGYDSRGNRVLSVEAVGLPEQRTTRFRFDNEHRQVLRTGMAYVTHDGRSVTPADRLRYDALGRVVEELTAGHLVDNAVVGGRRSLAWYDARGLRSAELSADAVLAQFTYDPAGQLVVHRIAATRLTSPPARPGGAAPTAAASSDDRRLTYVYDPLGRRTETWLDGVWHWESGQPVTLPGAERIALERLAYDAAGNVVQRTDARGNASYAYFDRLGRRMLAIDAEGYATAWDYGRALMEATRETRFAGRLAGGYARQDDAMASLAARDPQALRTAAAQASAALPAGEAEADRVTSFQVDRLGRVVERRVAAVVADDVTADGTRRQHVADAVVQTDYDGLGHVVQTRELLGDASDPDGWEVTDVEYDLLGREVARVSPGFVDFRGILVRPSTELEYDGLGRVERRLQRGTTAGSEADDRITGYRYDGNGRLVEETDAAGAVTRYAYDAAGNLALRTSVAVRRSDGSSRDLATRYELDVAGRVVGETDLDTGELRRTRYNAFGEVSARGLGDGWQEFAEYTTLGKVWKTNAGDGAVKIYLQDRNGNTTREIKAAAAIDLRATSLAAASRDETLLHSTSVYDKRGLLRQTLEPEFTLLASSVTLGQQFVEQWVPQYGDLNAAATMSQQASIQDGQRYTTVSAGSAALTPLSAVTPGFTQSVDGIVLGTAPVQTDPAVPAVMKWHALSYALPDGVFRSSAASIEGFWTYVYLPDGWPAGEYRVTETVGTDAVVITTTAAPGGPVKIGNLHGSTRTRSLQFDYRFASTEPWAPVATAQYTKDMDYESYTVEWGGLTVSTQPNRRVVLDAQVWGGASSFKVFLDPDGGAPTALAVKAFGTSTRFDAVDLPATLTGAHTLRIVALDASGNVLRGGDYAVGTPATDANGNPLPTDVSSLAPKTSTGLEKGSDGFVWIDYTGATRTLRYQSSGTNLGTGVTLRYRRAVTNGRGTWSSVVLSGNAADLKPLALPNGSYEFVVEFGGSNADLYRYGKFTVSAGSIVVPNSMLQRVTRRSELVDIAGTSGGLVSIAVGGYTASAYVASGASSVRFDLGGLREKLGIDRWESGTASYTYTSKDASGKVTHADRGTFAFGPLISVPSSDGGNAAATTDGVTEYQPEALLTVAGAAGRVVATPKTGGGTSASWAADGSDWHVRRQGDGLVVNLRQWLPAWGAAANTVQLRYEGSDGLVATVDFTVAANGTVTRASTVVQQTYKPELPLVVPGAATMRMFKVGIDDASVNAATANEPIGGVGPDFVWDASSRLGQTLRYYYEAVDAAGKLVGKGRGKVVVAANGDITQTPDAPLPIPYVRFSPPTATSSFTLQIRPQGSTAAYATYTSGWTSGADRVYDFDAKRPASGTAAYDYLFTAKDAGGKILTKGSGTLAIQSSGAIAVTNVEEHVAVPVLFKLGRQVTKALLTVERNGVRTTATLLGTWVPPAASADGSPGRLGYTRFEWDAAAMGSSAGVTAYDYTLVAQDASGNTVLDEIGRPVTQGGRIELDPNGSQPVQLLQKVEALNEADSVVVSRLQSHNAFGEVVEERDERVADRMADMLGRALTSTEQAGARTTLRYDTRGRLISKTDPQTHVTLANGYRYRDRPVTRYGYDLLGRLTTVTDANGNLSRQVSLAGARGDASASTRGFLPDGGLRQTAYDVFGDARRSVDAEGHVVEQRFDGLSRLLQSDRLGVRRVMDDAGTRGAATTLSSRYAYDQLGRRLSQSDAAGQTIRTDYDGLGRVVRSVSGQGFTTSYRYEVVAAGASGGVLGVGGANVGGIRLTTTQSTGRSTIDKIDYFGHTTWHRDLGGSDTVYSYDRAARLVAQTGAAHGGQPATQDIRYAYYANGFVQSVTDRAGGSVSEYGYDNAGNRAYEAYFQLVDGNKNTNYQNATLTYDELNRLAGVRDSNYFDIRYEYDAKGNRRLVESVYWDGLAGLRSGRQAYWYDYDGMDRFVVTKGTLSGARATSRADATVRVIAGSEGTVLAYDRLGQRRSATYTYDGQLVAEAYDYSEDGYLETVRQAGVLKGVRVLDAIGRTLQYHDKQNRTSTVSTYDADSRLLKQVYTDAEEGANSGTTTYAYYSDANDSASSANGAGALARTVFTPDDAGETFVNTSYRYVYWDEAKQSEITKQADRLDMPTWYPGRSYLYYNANGHLERVWDQVAALDTRYFNSANGQILKREKLQNGTRVGSHFYYYAGGRRVGDVSDDPGDNPRVSYAEQLATKRDELPDAKKLYKTFKPVRSADFDQNFEPINESYPAAAPSSYTVRDSQDLQGIASQLWGDRSMWYLIAEANGLRGDETLVSGQVLVIPNKITNIHNNADTFRPYNPGEAIGRIDPTLPPPPMPQSGGCGDMGAVVSAAIAIAVAAATGIPAGTSIASLLGVTAGTTTTIAGYAAGAALGSAAGQSFNIAAELQNGFSWRQVGQSALAGAIGSGVSELVGNFDALAFLREGSFAAAGRAAIGSGLNQVLHGNWDWRGVMATAVGAGIGSMVSESLQGALADNEAGKFGRRLIVAAVAASAARTASRQPLEIGSAIGNALGSTLAEVASGSSYAAEDMVRDFQRENNRFTAAAAANGSGASGSWGGMESIDHSLASGGTVRMGTGSVDSQSLIDGDAEPFRQEQLARIMRLANAPAALGSEGTPFRVDIAGLPNLDEYNAAQVQRAFEKGLNLRPTYANAALLDLQSLPNSPGPVGYSVGGTELLLSGIYNQMVRIGGGAVSAPVAVFDGVDAAVAIQDGVQATLGYHPRSDGAAAILDHIAPVASYVRSNIINPMRAFSEDRLGDGMTTVLGAGLQAGLEIYGTVTGLRAAGSLSSAAPSVASLGRVSGSRAAQLGALELGNVADALPNGLAYRLDLPAHLAGPDGFTKSGQLSGTHNLDNATTALDAKGAIYTLTSTGTDGISELSYSYVKPTSGKTITGSKTVYDSSRFSDETMLDYSLNAGQRGWTRYLADPTTTSFDVTHGGVNFRVYVNIDQYGNPYVGNVHPIK